ncbi:MAG: fructose-1,6-bisphosphatase [Bacteroidales bacterium]|nr:fructose-1,6-bisphosphatase [Bacteroidales bacterium]MDD4670651.1 fructose-1,6-bisphosphatase [Bacteroidales bacterium]
MNPDVDLKYLQLLAKSFPSIQEASTEIINLEAILNLPKGTEHFISDLHGEYGAFQHVLRNASGVIKSKVELLFSNTLKESERQDLCTLIYYPEEKLKIVRQTEKEINDWYKITLIHVIKVCSMVSSKYTRSKLRKALPKEYSYIIQELMHESLNEPNKQEYLYAIIATIISTGRAEHFITAICYVIQRLTIDCLHVIGDIYDRGPGAHLIMDELCNYHNLTIQWGNHDLLWMGAAAGNAACMANVLRISLRYANLRTLEDGYGINLLPLATFAMETYRNDTCTQFKPKLNSCSDISLKEIKLISQMHKAMAIIQFKLEGALINKRAEFKMSGRNLLHHVNYEKGTITIDGREYPLKDRDFQTVDPANPYELTPEEKEVVNVLLHNFTNNPVLLRHIRCLLSRGSLYLIRNGNLLFHASVPLNEDGSLKQVDIAGTKYKGKALFDKIESIVRNAFFAEDSAEKEFAKDYLWYLWCGPYSPSFDKDKMTTFERYQISDKSTHTETNGYYTKLKDRKDICEMILHEFGIDGEHTHIINGHVPVKTLKGESPIKAEGKLFVIDGGYSKAYQPETGIAGYTLIFNSHGLSLVQHEPFSSVEEAVRYGTDIKSERRFINEYKERILVRDTDIGASLKQQSADLKDLLEAYRLGLIRQQI